MTVAADTSVLIASLDPDEAHHPACNRLLAGGGIEICAHALAEAFAILTGGGGRRRLRPEDAASLLEQQVLPYVHVIPLSSRDYVSALGECGNRGIRGGAIYDFLHLTAARKAGADKLVTLDVRDFLAFTRKGDPAIEAP